MSIVGAQRAAPLRDQCHIGDIFFAKDVFFLGITWLQSVTTRRRLFSIHIVRAHSSSLLRPAVVDEPQKLTTGANAVRWNQTQKHRFSGVRCEHRRWLQRETGASRQTTNCWARSICTVDANAVPVLATKCLGVRGRCVWSLFPWMETTAQLTAQWDIVLAPTSHSLGWNAPGRSAVDAGVSRKDALPEFAAEVRRVGCGWCEGM